MLRNFITTLLCMFDEKVQIIIITISCFGPTEELSIVTQQSLKMKLVLFITIISF